MNSFHASTLSTLLRVQRFLDQFGPSLGNINASGYRKILDDTVAQLSAHATNQTASHHTVAAELAKERVLRNALRLNDMRPIASVAAAQLRQVPEFVALKMPPNNSTSRGLISWAEAMKAAAALHADVFVGAGLAADFLDKLQAASDALAKSLTDRGATGAAGRGATVGLNAEATRGRQAVRVLDSLVEPLIQGDLSLLAQWSAAKRFGGRVTVPTSTSIDAAAGGPTTPIAGSVGAPVSTAPSPTPASAPPASPAPAAN